MKTAGDVLIEQMLSNPARFRETGKPYALLQEYFHGFPLHTLKPLIGHDDIDVRRSVVWIISELGHDGCPLLLDVKALIGEGDRYISYHVLDILIACAS